MLLSIVACDNGLPEGVLSKGDMEEVLYDMHRAQALYDSHKYHNTQEDLIALRASVLKKYGITQADWGASMQYYSENADLLHDIYLAVADRAQQDVIALGGKVDGVQSAEADTANVWRLGSDMILMQQPRYNNMSFAITPDSTFQDGDRIVWQFDTQFLFQDGLRDLTACLNIYYDRSAEGKTDSISTHFTHVCNDGHGIITVNNDVDRLHIKNITGLLILTHPLTAETTEQKSSTLRLVAIRNIKLLHLPTVPPASQQNNETPKDSLHNDSTQQNGNTERTI